MGQPLGRKALAPVVDCQCPVQVRVDIDARRSIAPAARPGQELEQAAVELDRVIVPDGPLVLEAADPLEVGGRGLPGRLGMRGRVGEARIVAGEKPVAHALGCLERPGLGEPEFGDEAILEGAKEPLDPALALWRGGGDPANAQFVQGPSNLGRGHHAVQLLGERLGRAGIAVKEAVAIGVGSRGHAVAADETAEQEKVAVRIFLGAKDGREDLAGGIVDGGQEHEARPAIFEPGMVTAVHLDEQTRLGHAFAAPPVPGWPARAGTAEAGRAQETLHRFPGHPHAFAVREQFGELVIIHAGVDGPRQAQDASADGRGEPTWGGAAAVPVGEGRGAVLLQAPAEAPEMARRETQELGGFPGPQDTVNEARHDVHALVLPLGQGNRLPHHGRTYSLTH